MALLLKIVFLIIPFVAFYLYRLLRWYRLEQFKDFPQARPSIIWGHLKVIHEIMQTCGHPGRHAGKEHAHYIRLELIAWPDYVMHELVKRANYPPIMIL